MDLGVIARGIGLGAAALVLDAAAAALWVLIYSLAIAPGHDGAFYQAYGQQVAPVSTLIVGVPLLFAAGWLNGRRGTALAAIVPALAYIAIDLLLATASGLMLPVWSLLLSYAAKLAASYAGGMLARRRRHPSLPAPD